MLQMQVQLRNSGLATPLPPQLLDSMSSTAHLVVSLATSISLVVGLIAALPKSDSVVTTYGQDYLVNMTTPRLMMGMN